MMVHDKSEASRVPAGGTWVYELGREPAGRDGPRKSPAQCACKS